MHCRTRLFAVLPSHLAQPERKVTTAMGAPHHPLLNQSQGEMRRRMGEFVKEPL